MNPAPWLPVLLLAALPAAACDLDCSLDRELRAQGLAGAVYAIVDGDETRVGAVGLANAATGRPLRADSRVHVGSVAKTFLALGVLRLATQGRVSLDAPVAELLPRMHIANAWQSRTPVTLRHLLDHTSGLDDLRLWQFFSQRVGARAPLQQAFARPADLLRVRVEPGTRFSYSNMGYTLAGLVIEAVTGERYESWLDRELLAPLRMTDSTFEFVSQSGPGADARLAWGHFDDLGLAEARPVWLRPAAQFTTTAADMALAARFLMGDGRIGGERFIDAALLRQMGIARTDAAAAGLRVGYALGLATRDRHGVVGRCHSGSIVGFRAMLCTYPQSRQGFFVSINSDRESAQYARFDEMLVRELRVTTPAVPGSASAGSLPAASWRGWYVPAPARFETFRYFDLLMDVARLDTGAGALELHRPGGAPLRLDPVGSNSYRAPDRRWASHVLLSSGEDRLISDGARTLIRVPGAWLLLNGLSLAAGVAGLLFVLFFIPWRAWRHREPWLQPASLALVLLVLPIPLFALQPFMALGDRTAASLALFVGGAALPLLMCAQAIWAWRARARLRSWRLHVVAAAAVLQWCAVLIAWDLLPFALWR